MLPRDQSAVRAQYYFKVTETIQKKNSKTSNMGNWSCDIFSHENNSIDIQ